MKRLFKTGVLLIAICTAGFSQTQFHGLTAGQSTRTDVERVLGKPVKDISQTLVEYRPTEDARARVSKVYIQYRKGSTIVERIEALATQPIKRSDVLANLHLPQKPAASTSDANGRFLEYFGNPSYVVLTYESPDVSTGVSRTARYSPELFESVVRGIHSGGAPATSSNSASGRWSGSWTNSKGESGESSITLIEQDGGRIKGDERRNDKRVIENGHRSGNVLTWEYRNLANGCLDYNVRWEISGDGRTANGTYKVTDRCEKQASTGQYINYHR